MNGCESSLCMPRIHAELACLWLVGRLRVVIGLSLRNRNSKSAIRVVSCLRTANVMQRITGTLHIAFLEMLGT